jgi:hypothetical protein
MCKKHCLSIALVAGVAALSALRPTAAQSQTLLENAVFLITQGEFKETSPGVLQTYQGDGFPLEEEGSPNVTWSVKDEKNCIIRVDYSARDFKAWKQFYLNNILPRYEIGYEGGQKLTDGEYDKRDYIIKLVSETAVYCEGLAAGKAVCRRQLSLRTPSREMLGRRQRALDDIFRKFCSFSEYKKPF